MSFRPAENVKNEVALVLGFTAKDNGPASATIGTASYVLITKDANAWLKNPAEEGQAIATMAQGLERCRQDPIRAWQQPDGSLFLKRFHVGPGSRPQGMLLRAARLRGSRFRRNRVIERARIHQTKA